MVQAIALQELKNGGKIVGYKLKDETGQIMDIKTSAIVNAMNKNLINIPNLTITSSGDLVMEKETPKVAPKPVVEQPKPKAEAPKQVIIEENIDESNPKIKRMQKLITDLNAATAVYEQGKDEIMSNKEWDSLYDELLALEAETGTVLANSPT